MSNILSVDIDGLTTAQGQLGTLITDVESFQASANQLWTNLTNALAGSTVTKVGDYDAHVTSASSGLDAVNTALVSLNSIITSVLTYANDAAGAL